LANQYIQQHLQSLSITMSSKGNSIQDGLNLYNEGKLQQALQQFEAIIIADTSSFNAKKYAGIVSLQLEQFDKAITYFTQLENYRNLYSNPGKLLKAITLMKRNNAGDVDQAKNLLHEVVQNNLEGKRDAEKLLSKL
jgi:tetratricopeptide (TPR) repeat protein